jgi:hypothetical protein
MKRRKQSCFLMVEKRLKKLAVGAQNRKDVRPVLYGPITIDV